MIKQIVIIIGTYLSHMLHVLNLMTLELRQTVVQMNIYAVSCSVSNFLCSSVTLIHTSERFFVQHPKQKTIMLVLGYVVVAGKTNSITKNSYT